MEIISNIVENTMYIYTPAFQSESDAFSRLSQHFRLVPSEVLRKLSIQVSAQSKKPFHSDRESSTHMYFHQVLIMQLHRKTQEIGQF